MFVYPVLIGVFELEIRLTCYVLLVNLWRTTGLQVKNTPDRRQADAGRRKEAGRRGYPLDTIWSDDGVVPFVVIGPDGPVKERY